MEKGVMAGVNRPETTETANASATTTSHARAVAQVVDVTTLGRAARKEGVRRAARKEGTGRAATMEGTEMATTMEGMERAAGKEWATMEALRPNTVLHRLFHRHLGQHLFYRRSSL